MVFIDPLLDSALVASLGLLSFQATTASTHAAFGLVHSLLERVVFPAEDVVAVLTKPGVVAGGKYEGLRTIRWPVRLVVEVASVLDDL
jgi:hypothetical protein